MSGHFEEFVVSFRPTRSMVRRFMPLLVVLFGAFAYILGAGSADASSGESVGNQTQPCLGYAAFKSYHFTVDGKDLKPTFSSADLLNQTKQGSTIELSFVLNTDCDNTFVGLNTYQAPAATFKLPQTLFQKDTGTFKADGSTHTLKVKNPNCFFQVDAYTNRVFVVGQFTKAGEASFLTADNGGTQKCMPATTTTAKPKPTTTTTAKPKPTTTTTAKPKPTTTTMKPTTTTTVPVTPNEAAIESVCKVGASGWTVTYTNSGSATEQFVLMGAGKTIDTVSVDAGKTSTKSYAFADNNVAAGQSLDLTVTSGGNQIAAQTVTNNCDSVTVNVTSVCNTATGVASAVFTLDNTGMLDETVTIMDGATAIDISPVTVPAGTSVTKTSTVPSSGTTTFTITDAAAGLNTTKSVTTSCTAVEAVSISNTPPPAAPQVLGETIAKPALAFTGFTVKPLVITGTLFFIIGGALIIGARRSKMWARYSHQ
jgi:hypothetical protein